MKKLLLSVFAVALLPLLMAGVVLAEPTDPNEIGLYVTQDGTGPTGTTVIGTPVEVYLFLTRPTDVEENGQPFISFAGFECLFTFNPVPSLLILLSTELPPQSLDIGRYKDIQEGMSGIHCGNFQSNGSSGRQRIRGDGQAHFPESRHHRNGSIPWAHPGHRVDPRPYGVPGRTYT